jgi:hypothetical protein
MGLRRARRRGRAQVLEQCLLTALVQNIKRIVAAVSRPPAAVLSALAAAAGRHSPAFGSPNWLRWMSERLVDLWRPVRGITWPPMISWN